MNATMTCSSCVTREVDDTPSYAPVTHSAHGASACLRCGGLLVDEHCMDSGGGYRLWAMRCVQCGDLIDETILVNRYAPRHTLEQFVRAA